VLLLGVAYLIACAKWTHATLRASFWGVLAAMVKQVFFCYAHSKQAESVRHGFYAYRVVHSMAEGALRPHAYMLDLRRKGAVLGNRKGMQACMNNGGSGDMSHDTPGCS
jgi:hypothetical protein